MKKTNLVFVIADQLGYDKCGYSGDGKALTPNIDQLSRDGVDMCQAISGHPVCAPYRASLFTGKYTTSTGMVINEIRMNTNHHTFADVLNENDYNTSYIGKWHLYANELGNHYDSRNSFIPKGRDRLGFDGYFAAYNFRHDFQVGTAYYHLDSPEKHYYDKYEPDAQVDMAIEQLNLLKEADKPFALFLSVGTPHDPWTPDNVPHEALERFKDIEFAPPPNYLPNNDPYADNWARLSEDERSELADWMRVYYAMTANLDDNIGRLRNALKELSLEEDTIFVFTSDHGELFGAHGRRAKNIFYEEAIRIPFLAYWKNKLQSGVRCDTVFNTVDVMPSLLGLMGLPIPKDVEGSDYSSCITGEDDSDEGALMMGTGATAIWEDGHEWRGFRTKRFTYATYLVDDKELLFDNAADPYQVNNLIENPEYSSIHMQLKQQMAQKMSRINDTFEKSSYYENNWVEDRIIKRTATLID